MTRRSQLQTSSAFKPFAIATRNWSDSNLAKSGIYVKGKISERVVLLVKQITRRNDLLGSLGAGPIELAHCMHPFVEVLELDRVLLVAFEPNATVSFFCTMGVPVVDDQTAVYPKPDAVIGYRVEGVVSCYWRFHVAGPPHTETEVATPWGFAQSPIKIDGLIDSRHRVACEIRVVVIVPHET